MRANILVCTSIVLLAVFSCDGSNDKRKAAAEAGATADGSADGSPVISPEASPDVSADAVPETSPSIEASAPETSTDSAPLDARQRDTAVDPGPGDLVCLPPSVPVGISTDCNDYFLPGSGLDLVTNDFTLDTGGLTDAQNIIVRIGTDQYVGARPWGDSPYSIDGDIITVDMPTNIVVYFAYIELFDVVDPDDGRAYRTDGLRLTWDYRNDAGAVEHTCNNGGFTAVPFPLNDCMDLVGPGTRYDESSDTLYFEGAAGYALEPDIYLDAPDCGESTPDGVVTAPGSMQWTTTGCPGATSFGVYLPGLTDPQGMEHRGPVEVLFTRTPTDGGFDYVVSCGVTLGFVSPMPLADCIDTATFVDYDETNKILSWDLASKLRPTAINVGSNLDAPVALPAGELNAGILTWDLSGLLSPAVNSVQVTIDSFENGCGLPFFSTLLLSFAVSDAGTWTPSCDRGDNCYPACAEACFCEE